MSKKIISVAKGQILQSAGDMSSKAYQVQAGLLRSYTIDEKGKEHIFLFGPEGWYIGDFKSKEQKSSLFIDALEDSVVVVLDKHDNLPEPETELLFKRLAVMQERILMLMSAKASVRYEHFKHTYPEIVQRVPQRMIASYLGITPEALSKMKAEQLRQSAHS